jgi:tripartite-type tricarboxylate transporter receptor subunit TctC
MRCSAMLSAFAGLCALTLGPSVGSATRADSVSDFYKDKQISLILSAGEGGGYATYVRAFTPFFSQYIPGRPSIVVQSLPGAGGIRAMMHFQSAAPRDGTVLGLVHSGVPFAPLFGISGADFDARKMNWIGALTKSDAICVAWHSSGIVTWDDLLNKEFVVGGTGAGSQLETYPALLNALFGTKIKIVSGYKGGNDIYLAMERGEVQGRCGGGVASLEATRPDWLSSKKVSVPVVYALERSRESPDAVALLERAKDERTRQIIRLALAPQNMDRPFLAPAGVPPERVAALRKAFWQALNDPQFLAQAKHNRLEIDGVRGEDVEAIISEAYRLSPDVVKATATAMKIH